eukprot:6178438-Pleurochrysis_carterae.AAC.1
MPDKGLDCRSCLLAPIMIRDRGIHPGLCDWFCPKKGRLCFLEQRHFVNSRIRHYSRVNDFDDECDIQKLLDSANIQCKT